MLMTIMAFLILTAAWTSMSALSVTNSTSSAAADPSSDPPKPVHLALSTSAIQVRDDDEAGVDIARVGASHDWPAVTRALQKLKDRGVARDSLDIAVDDGVAYDDVAHLVDVSSVAGLGAGGGLALASAAMRSTHET